MKQLIYFLIIAIYLPVISNAQYTTEGKIEYERKTNVYRQMENDYGSKDWFDRVKSQIPKFKTSYFDLTFNTTKTIYKPGRQVESNSSNTGFDNWGSSPAPDNIVLTDLTKDKVIALKNVFEEKFDINDTMRKIKWRITGEIRTIANYKCRKAVGKILDSVYVVAFYTDDIMVSGGPEMFSGLPGMILELAIPRLYTTWIATKVDITPPKEADFAVQEKGRKVNQKELFDKLLDHLKDWGEWGQHDIWWSVL